MNETTYQTKLTSNGRVLIPKALRDALHLLPGDGMVIFQDGDKLSLKAFSQILQEMDIVRNAENQRLGIKAGTTALSDELIFERRQAAKNE